jgi:hypothetical protein
MVDPKTKVWYPTGRLAQWQYVPSPRVASLADILLHRPRQHHVVNLLHALRDSFQTTFLADLKEDEAINKQIWSYVPFRPDVFHVDDVS